MQPHLLKLISLYISKFTCSISPGAFLFLFSVVLLPSHQVFQPIQCICVRKIKKVDTPSSITHYVGEETNNIRQITIGQSKLFQRSMCSSLADCCFPVAHLLNHFKFFFLNCSNRESMCSYGFRVYFMDTCVSIKSIDGLHHNHVAYIYTNILQSIQQKSIALNVGLNK